MIVKMATKKKVIAKDIVKAANELGLGLFFSWMQMILNCSSW